MKKEITILSKVLTKNKLTLSIAESLTGGALSASLVSLPGATAYFKGGIIAYDNSIKTSLLNVSIKTLTTHGAVSSQCAKEMVRGVKKLLSTNTAIAVTGIAGPSGGTTIKPVGLVYAGFIIKNRLKIKEYHFKGSRDKIIRETVRAVLRDATSLIRVSVNNRK